MANLNVTVNTEYNGRGIRQAQADFSAFEATRSQLVTRIKDLNKVLDNVRPNSAVFRTYSQEINKAQQALDRLNQSARTGGNFIPSVMGDATSSVIEFNRVIQDAPYGIQGVGNNIQALTQNFAYLVGQSGSASAAVGQFFKSLITPANLAVLAVSAITTAWTIYVRSQQQANKETQAQVKALRDQKSALDDFVETLDAQGSVSVKAAGAAAEESIKLKTLYGITQDLTFSMKDRNRAADQLQSLYPEYFKNQTNEAILAGNSANSYDRLAKSILSTARARAAIDISADNSKQLVAVDIKRQKSAEKRLDLQKKLDDANKDANAEIKKQTGFAGASMASAFAVAAKNTVVEDLKKQLDDINDTDREDYKKKLSLMQDQYSLQKIINDEVKKGADITGKHQDFTEKPKAIKNDPTDIIKDTLQTSTDATGKEGLSEYKKNLEALTQEYAKYTSDIDKYQHEQSKRGIDVSKEAEDAKTILAQQQAQRRAQIDAEEAQRAADNIQRINDISGVNSEQTMQKELLAVDKWKNAESAKAGITADEITAIEEGAQKQRDAIREKYYQKYLDAQDKLSDKIKAVEEQGFSQNKTGLASDTKKIQEELQKRIDKINELYDAMQKLNGNDPVSSAITFGLRQASIAVVTKKASGAADSTDYQAGRALNAAIADFTGKMYDSLANVGKKNAEITDKYNKARENATDAEIQRLNAMEKQEKKLANSFGTIFSGIFDTFNNSLQNLFKNSLTQLLKTSFSKGLEDLNLGGLGSKVSGAIVAGASLAGSAISSIGGGKNTATSALGGALSGAASGAVLGSVVPGIGTVAGAIAGGLVGAVSGIFGSSSRRKQEELQKQQLEEQKKTNALIDRQNKLSYSSQIIGRVSDRGVITGVDVNEFGEITTKLNGTDIVLAYDRTKQKQNRGN